MLTVAPFLSPTPKGLTEMGREWVSQGQIKTPLGLKSQQQRALLKPWPQAGWRDGAHVLDGVLPSQAVRTEPSGARSHSSDSAEKAVSLACRPPASLSWSRLTARVSGAAAGSQPELWCRRVGQMVCEGGQWALRPSTLLPGQQSESELATGVSLIKMEVDILYC